jgi:hypothetical protein
MEGYVDVMVLGERSDYFEPARPRSYPLCSLTPITDAHAKELERNRQLWYTNKCRDITTLINQLEANIASSLKIKPSSMTVSTTSPPMSPVVTTRHINGDDTQPAATAPSPLASPSVATSSSSSTPSSVNIVADLNALYKQIDDTLQMPSMEPFKREQTARLQRALRDIRSVAV